MSLQLDTVTYLAKVDQVWNLIEDRIEERQLDCDCYKIGSVFTVEAPNKAQVIINRQEPKHELWLASTLGAYHFVYENGQWVSTIDKTPFWKLLDQAFTAIGEAGDNFADLY